MSDERKARLERHFEEARNGARPLQGYGERQVNLTAAQQTAQRNRCSVDEVVETVRKQGRHREF